MNIQSNLYRLIKIILLIISTCMISMLIVSCGSNTTSTGSDSGNNDNSDNNADSTSTPTYTFSNVKKIFSNSCATSGCHDSSTKQNGVDLSSYDAATSSVGNQYGKKVIQPNDAAGSPLVDKISSDKPQYGVRMPKGRAALSSDDINLIKQWINNGAKNN